MWQIVENTKLEYWENSNVKRTQRNCVKAFVDWRACHSFSMTAAVAECFKESNEECLCLYVHNDRLCSITFLKW